MAFYSSLVFLFKLTFSFSLILSNNKVKVQRIHGRRGPDEDNSAISLRFREHCRRGAGKNIRLGGWEQVQYGDVFWIWQCHYSPWTPCSCDYLQKAHTRLCPSTFRHVYGRSPLCPTPPGRPLTVQDWWGKGSVIVVGCVVTVAIAAVNYIPPTFIKKL